MVFLMRLPKRGFQPSRANFFSVCFSTKLVEEGCMEQPCVHSTPKEINPDNAQSMGESFEAVIGSVRVEFASMPYHCCCKSKVHFELCKVGLWQMPANW